ncbi:uncharacterized protein LOC132061273 [Lycium ferocissimum]|uniref:uncharacterized protein LOC132061273 n=1 Tax=Lycium ferocissimum TaxID=112874 RepID=UPI002814EF83|nr:uncharacterized protein LOC132061273 [Lycium ferocissimum]
MVTATFVQSHQCDVNEDICTWHRRLGHAPDRVLMKIPDMKFHIDSSRIKECTIHPLARQERSAFTISMNRSIVPLEMIHADIWVLIESTLFGSSVKFFRSDNATEFFNIECNALFQTYRIIHQSSCIHTPQQNGLVERKHRHILEVARAIRLQGHLPLKFWGECIQTAVYVINRMPLSVLHGKSSFEGYEVLESIFPFQLLKTRNCKLFPNSVISTNEELSLTEISILDVADDHADPSDSITLAPMLAFTDHDHTDNDPEDTALAIANAPVQNVDVRRSTRIRSAPLWMQEYICHTKPTTNTSASSNACIYPMSSYLTTSRYSALYQAFLTKITTLQEPQCYAKAALDSKVDSGHGQELQALKDNGTWSLTQLPLSKVPIGCK